MQTVIDLNGNNGRFEGLWRYIFGNLLSNAIKYSSQGGQVVFRISNDAVATCFEVSDQGIEIPEG